MIQADWTNTSKHILRSGNGYFGRGGGSCWQVAEQKGERYGQNNNRMEQESGRELGKPRIGRSESRRDNATQIGERLKALFVSITTVSSSALK
jgi:hypothetical protein